MSTNMERKLGELLVMDNIITSDDLVIVEGHTALTENSRINIVNLDEKLEPKEKPGPE